MKPTSILYANITLSQKNIVPKLSFEQVTSYKLQVFNFRSTGYSKPYTYTLIIHSYVLPKPPFCNNNGY